MTERLTEPQQSLEGFILDSDHQSLSESEKEVALLLAGGKALPLKKRRGRGRPPKCSKPPNTVEVAGKPVERERRAVRIPRDPHLIPHQMARQARLVRADDYLHADDMLRIGGLVPGCEPLAEGPKAVIYKTRDYILHLERELDSMKRKMNSSIAGTSLRLPPIQDRNLRGELGLNPS